MKAKIPYLEIVVGTGAAVAIALWLWRCFCVFPWLLWNEVRLEPSFVLLNGLPLYPTPGQGPVTTWMYGPVGPLLYLPAALAPTAVAALLTAAAINTALVAGSVVFTCAAWPGRCGPWERLLAMLCCLAVWPASSLQYIQADNAAVAAGLVSTVVLLRSSTTNGKLRWLAAAAGVASIACKQTAVAPLLAQLAWLAWSEGARSAMCHMARAAVIAIVLTGVLVGAFGQEGLWLNLVRIPSELPWADSFAQRLQELAPWLVIHLVLPALVIVAARKVIFTRGTPMLLATLGWMAALPLGLAAVLKTGGTINSMHGLLLFLPAALVAWFSRDTWSTGARAALGTLALASAVIRLSLSPTPAWKPVTGHLRQADAIARQLPGEVWFPWNPLVTYFADGRLDHAEDGLYVRQLTGHPLSTDELRAGLPPHWSVVALLTNSAHWGYSLELTPPQAQSAVLGNWTLHSWLAPHRTATARHRSGIAGFEVYSSTVDRLITP